MLIVDMHAHPLLDALYSVRDGNAPSGSAFPADPFGPRLGLDALARGRLGVVVSSIYPYWHPTRGAAYMDRCRDILDLVEAALAEHEDGAALAKSSAEIGAALAQERVAFVHAVEGGHVLEGRAENLETLYGWGVRSLTLTHFLNNDIAASAFDPRRALAGRDGLTPFGREVVVAMGALGMVIDLAHCSDRAFYQALDAARRPVIVSHTGVRHFVPREICLSDDQLRALAENGGIVGVILSGFWLRRHRLAADIGNLVTNVLYVCDLVGVNHVGIGTDMNGTPPIRGVATAGDLPRVWGSLLEAGLSEEDVEKVMGGNFLRLFAQVVG